MSSPTGGGVRTYIDRKLAVMAALGHQQIVIAPGREDRVEERPGGGRIHYVTSPVLPFDANYGLFKDAAPIHALLDEYQPDVVENVAAVAVGGDRRRLARAGDEGVVHAQRQHGGLSQALAGPGDVGGRDRARLALVPTASWRSGWRRSTPSSPTARC
ncbi:glycosyltransferase [Sphingomonas sp. MMS24-JH45]